MFGTALGSSGADPQARLDTSFYTRPSATRKGLCMDTFPDLGALTDEELKEMIQQLTGEEQEVSYQRRILHGKIDILRAELVNRLRKKHEEGESAISGADVQQLTDILSGKATPDTNAADDPEEGSGTDSGR